MQPISNATRRKSFRIYDEKEMTVKEYENMALMKSVVEENTSGIVESVTQFQKDAVIDEYTQQLIEEGLI